MEPINAHLIQSLWIAWGLYWWIAAANVKATTRHESVASRAAHLLPLALAGSLLVRPTLLGRTLANQFLPVTPTTYFGGATVVACGLAFAVWARIHLGRNWSGTVTLKQDHELIRSGPYRFMRHPIYTGLLAGFLGTAVARGTWSGLLAVLIAFGALWRKLRLEERWLGETFGTDYARYRAEVAALIPFLL